MGDKVRAGDKLGTVPEKIFQHRIMVPFAFQGEWEVTEIASKGNYTIQTAIAKLKDVSGKVQEVKMVQSWPVKVAIKAYAQKLKPTQPLVTKLRIIDTLVPVAIGGTFCTPGPFRRGENGLATFVEPSRGSGYCHCSRLRRARRRGRRDIGRIPHLVDPRTGKTLMERTIIICNTSSMPVAARESSVYTGVTLAEYYRQMGLNVLLLADSTSRWAQAMREMSGRLEEIPGEEAFPAYLESRIANFYERAGLVKLRDGSMGSVTIGGAVSPAGGNFEEPVTQATLKVVGAFHGLSRDRANARKYPSIDPLESWSKYTSFIEPGHVRKGAAILKKSNSVNQMMKVVGEEGVSTQEFVDYLKGDFFDAVYLQQNAFDKTDEATAADRQKHVYRLITEIIDREFQLENKDAARRFFQQLRQSFVNWNSAAFQSEDFKGKKRHT